MRKIILPVLLVSSLLTLGISGTVMAADTLTASTHNSSISEATTQLANALIVANGDQTLISQALQAAVTAGLSSDEILVIAIANGVDPAIVTANLEDAQTAGGGVFSAAPAPIGPGFGGGSGGGAGTISSN